MLETIYLHLFLKLIFGNILILPFNESFDLLSETECCVGCLRSGGSGIQIYMFLNMGALFPGLNIINLIP